MITGISSLIIMPLVGNWSDKFDKFKIFLIATCWMAIMVVIFTNQSTIPFLYVAILNILMMSGILSRGTPAMALVTELPEPQDRGAFMSISSSLRQFSGGIAAAIGGLIVVQPDKSSPLQHYNTLGYILIVIAVVSILLLYKVSQKIKQKANKTEQIKPNDDVFELAIEV